MISCEEFERYLLQWSLLDLHKGQISNELQDALEQHRQICKSCRELTPELMQIRQRLKGLAKLEPYPGFEARLAQRIRTLNRSPKRWLGSLEESLAANWLAFGAGAAATVVLGFLLFSSQPSEQLPGSVQTAENQPATAAEPSTNPDMLTDGRENLPLGTVDDSTGEFHLTSEQDSMNLIPQPVQDWQGQPVSQNK
jgi:hypothetical protein